MSPPSSGSKNKQDASVKADGKQKYNGKYWRRDNINKIIFSGHEPHTG
jgi:hypothetical protein